MGKLKKREEGYFLMDSLVAIILLTVSLVIIMQSFSIAATTEKKHLKNLEQMESAKASSYPGDFDE